MLARTTRASVRALAVAIGLLLGASTSRAGDSWPIDQGWRFAYESGAPCEELADWNDRYREVRLPHTWNDVDTFDGQVGYARGRGCYRRTVEIDPRWSGKTVRLRFLGAYASARVFIDGRPLGPFEGEFTGFTVALPRDKVAQAGSHRIDVSVTNRHSADVLPGRPDPDYNLYGGLYREAFLEVLDPVHVEPEESFARPTPRGDGSWTIPVTVGLRNDGDQESEVAIEVTLASPLDGQSDSPAAAHASLNVPAGDLASTTVEIGPLPHPAVWSPEHPDLHQVSIAVHRDGRVVDRHQFAIGLRTARFDPELGFVLNGRRLELKGANRHQDFPGLGNALPAAFQELDVRYLKDMGGNFVRTSHYPQHPAFLDACDRLGIVVFEEIATWKTVGGAGFVRAAETMFRNMLRRDRNHPSIVLWGMMNEGRERSMFEDMRALARDLDPSRGVGYAEHRFERALEQRTAEIADAIGLNYRPEKYAEFKQAFPRGAFFVSEHTNQSHTARGDWDAELAQTRAIDADLERFEGLPWLAGHALWSLHDYGTERPRKPNRTIHNSGALDAARIPRASYRYLATRWSSTPRVEILTPPIPRGAGVTVPIATNCSSLAMRADGVDVGQRAGRPLLEWALAEPPRQLEILAICGETTVRARWSRSGAAARIALTSSLDVVPADGSNLAVVTFRVEDNEGRVVADFRGSLVVAVSGPGRARTIGGRGRVDVAAGMGAVAVEATSPGRIRVIASGLSLESRNLVLEAR